MSVTVETTYGAKKNTLKLHCGDCRKVIRAEEEGLEPFTDEDILLLMGLADIHVNHHPNHNPVVYVRTKGKEPNSGMA